MKYSKSFNLFVYQLRDLLNNLDCSCEMNSEEFFIYTLMINLAYYVKSTKTKGKKIERC